MDRLGRTKSSVKRLFRIVESDDFRVVIPCCTMFPNNLWEIYGISSTLRLCEVEHHHFLEVNLEGKLVWRWVIITYIYIYISEKSYMMGPPSDVNVGL